MKIPDGKGLRPEAEAAWEHAAAQFGIEQSIFVEVRTLYDAANHVVIEIWFEYAGHKFDNLTDLKRALQLKAFL